MYYLAFITGLVSSIHCVGMCGPIALALPIGRYNTFDKWRALIFYHVGRLLVYSIIGSMIGSLGMGLALWKWQQYISIFSGCILILYVLGNSFSHFKATFLQKYITLTIGKSLKPNTVFGFFKLGFLNGLLPCGVVYVAAFAALAMATPLASAVYMFNFGLGTVPAMLAVSFGLNTLPMPLRLKFSKIAPIFTVFVAMVLIVRGLNLGIPYLSPQSNLDGKTPVCCKKPKP